MRMRLAGMLILMSVAAAPALAQETPRPACATIDTALPAPFAGWTRKVPLRAALKPSELREAQINPGQAVKASLGVTSEVTFTYASSTPPPPASRSGLLDLRIVQSGRYAFALDTGAWVDVVRDGKALESADHGHAPPCSSIRKEVEFDLPPGRYVVQLSGSPKAEVAILVTRLR